MGRRSWRRAVRQASMAAREAPLRRFVRVIPKKLKKAIEMMLREAKRQIKQVVVCKRDKSLSSRCRLAHESQRRTWLRRRRPGAGWRRAASTRAGCCRTAARPPRLRERKKKEGASLADSCAAHLTQHAAVKG